jgi:hypothetical protein
MSDLIRSPSAWRTQYARGGARPRSVATGLEDDDMAPQPLLSFRDLAAIHIAAAVKGTSRELSPKETAEVAYDLAGALDEERTRRLHRAAATEAPGETALDEPMDG